MPACACSACGPFGRFAGGGGLGGGGGGGGGGGAASSFSSLFRFFPLLFFADSATFGDFAANLGDFLGVLVGVPDGTTW